MLYVVDIEAFFIIKDSFSFPLSKAAGPMSFTVVLRNGVVEPVTFGRLREEKNLSLIGNENVGMNLVSSHKKGLLKLRLKSQASSFLKWIISSSLGVY